MSKMNFNKTIKDLKERNDKLQEQYRLRDIRCVHLEKENEQLKKQTEEYKDGYFSLSKENIEYVNKLHKYKSQQKEFVKYLTDTIKNLECDVEDDEELRGYLIQRRDTFKEILSKYKEIIGEAGEDE